jgi:pyruvate/2-oxoglutarate dehydrogenase complex dihydrolipoamide dehydrogenase (E3) component
LNEAKGAAVDITQRYLDLPGWTRLIDRLLDEGSTEPIFNLGNNGEGTYDGIFIGGGAGGRFGAAYLKAMGGRPLIIERWPFLGGSCPHQACVPHHLFSDVAAELDLARWFSGTLFFPQWDPSRARILDIVNLFRAGRSSAHAFMNWQSKEQLEIEYILNTPARALDAHTVEAAGRTFSARNLVLNLGARSKHPDVPGVDLPGVFDFATLVEELDYEPTRAVVIGGGKTSLEYGSFFHATGCDTTIVSRSPLMRTPSLHHVDEDLRTYLVDGMSKRGVEIHEGAYPIEIKGSDRVERVTLQLADGETVEIETDFVFLGTGERPNSAPAVEWLGVETGPRGEIVVDKRMRTSVPDVYAIGDVIGPPMEMFKARKCGMTASKNIMGEPAEFDFAEYPDFLHTTYEVTWVGLSEEEARERYGNVIVIQMPPKGVSDADIPLPCAERTMLYAFAKPELSGFQKCVVDADSRRIVGAHHVGYGAKDAFQYLDYLIRRPEGLTVDEMGNMNELFLNPEHFIQLCRLRAGRTELVSL